MSLCIKKGVKLILWRMTSQSLPPLISKCNSKLGEQVSTVSYTNILLQVKCLQKVDHSIFFSPRQFMVCAQSLELKLQHEHAWRGIKITWLPEREQKEQRQDICCSTSDKVRREFSHVWGFGCLCWRTGILVAVPHPQLLCFIYPTWRK